MKIYKDLSNDKYHAMSNHISSSFVKSVSKHSIVKALQPIEPSPALLFGDAMHTYFESKESFHERFVVFKDSHIIEKILEDRPNITAPTMTKEYKSYKNDFECALQEGQSVISEDDMERIQLMYNSMLNNTTLQSLYEKYDHDELWDEFSFVTEDQDPHGLLYRVRPDRILIRDSELVAVLDWKSCRDASEKAFKSDFWRFRYDLQAAFYCDVLGMSMADFYYVAIEKEFPYNTAVFSINEETENNALKELELIKQRIGTWKKDPSPQNLGLENSNTITYL